MATKIQARKHPLVRRALAEPSRLSKQNENFWEDIREVLLDPDPPSWELEVVRRWLREKVEADLQKRVRKPWPNFCTRLACHMDSRLIWKLPYTRGYPPERYQRRIVAILLPNELKKWEMELARLAFREGL